MLKEKKGITLVALLVTIIVLIILASIAVTTGLETIDKARYYNVVAELKTMQTKVNEIYEEYQNGDETVKSDILSQGADTTTKATELSTAYNVASQNNLSGENLGNEEDYRYYNEDYIKNTLDIDGIDYDFFINIRTRAVLLVEPIKYQDETYYALCQIQGEQYNVKFEPSQNFP